MHASSYIADFNFVMRNPRFLADSKSARLNTSVFVLVPDGLSATRKLSELAGGTALEPATSSRDRQTVQRANKICAYQERMRAKTKSDRARI